MKKSKWGDVIELVAIVSFPVDNVFAFWVTCFIISAKNKESTQAFVSAVCLFVYTAVAENTIYLYVDFKAGNDL